MHSTVAGRQFFSWTPWIYAPPGHIAEAQRQKYIADLCSQDAFMHLRDINYWLQIGQGPNTQTRIRRNHLGTAVNHVLAELEGENWRKWWILNKRNNSLPAQRNDRYTLIMQSTHTLRWAKASKVIVFDGFNKPSLPFLLDCLFKHLWCNIKFSVKSARINYLAYLEEQGRSLHHGSRGCTAGWRDFVTFKVWLFKEWWQRKDWVFVIKIKYSKYVWMAFWF